MTDDRRTVEVNCAGQPPSRGSGYLVAPGLVLTSAHVVRDWRDRPERITVRRAGRTGGQAPAAGTEAVGQEAATPGDGEEIATAEVILPARPELEVALLRLVDADPADGELPIGELDVDHPLPFRAPGFPRSQREGEVRGIEVARGYTDWVSGRADRLPLNLTTAVPLPEQGRSNWSGQSGAAVLTLDNLLLGVVTHDRPDYGSRRLEAVPVTWLLQDRDLGPALPDSWFGSGCRRLSNLVDFALGPDLAVRLRPPSQWFGPRIRENLRGSIAAPLQTRYAVVPFLGRETELETLRRWRRAENPLISFAVLSGPGGIGKSRLASQLCAEAMAEGWVAGLATVHQTVPANRLSELARPVLLVLDYVDHQADLVADVVERCMTTEVAAPVRILVLARSAEVFRSRLDAAFGMTGGTPAEDIRLRREDFTAADRYAHYLAAHRAFHELRREEHPAPVAEPPVPTGEELAGELAAFPTPLLVHARALLDTLGPDPEPGPDDQSPAGPPGVERTAGELLDRLINREDSGFWAPALRRHDLGHDQRRDLFAVATFAGAETRDEARTVLTGIDLDQSAAARVADTLHDLYPGRRYLPAVEPDLLGEHLIAARLLPSGAQRLFAEVAGAGARSRMLESLLRMCGSTYGRVRAAATETLTGILQHHLPELVGQATGAVTAGDDPVASDAYLLPARLAAALALIEVPGAAAAAAEVTFPTQTRLQPLAAAVYEQAAGHWRDRGDLERAAQLWQESSVAYLAMGLPDVAIGPSNQALGYFAKFPTMTGHPQLSTILSSNSLIRLGAGNAAAAVQAAREAVEVARRAAEDDPDRYRRPLAEARRNLAFAHLSAFDRVKALSTAEDAVRDVAELPPVDGGRVLITQALVLMASGELESAIGATVRAVNLLKEADEPTEAELANTMIFLAILRAATGETSEALHLVGDAVTQADAITPATADTTRQAQALVRLGAVSVLLPVDRPAALEYAREARTRLSQLHAEAPAVYEFHLALSRIIQVEVLLEIGESDPAARDRAVKEALLVADQVDEMYTRRPRLYFSLRVMAAQAQARALAAADRAPRAIEMLTSVIEQARRVDLPGAQPMTAQLLVLKSLIESGIDADEESRETAREAALLYEQLLDEEVNLFPLALGARIIEMVSAAAVGRQSEAATAGGKAIEIARRYLRTAPGDRARRVLASALVIRAALHWESNEMRPAAALLREALAQYEVVTPIPGDLEDIDYMRERLQECLERISVDERSSPPTSRPLPGPAYPGYAAPPADAHPTGAFSTATLAELLTPEPSPEEPEPTRHRVVLGRWRGQPIRAVRFRPVLAMGPQRSRKTTGIVIPTLLEWDGPALVTSVRTDVLSATFRQRQQRGTVSVFEPGGRLVHGSAVTSWNPLDDCRTWEGAIVTAKSLTESARLGGDSGLRDSQFWYTSATQLLQALLYAAGGTGQSMAAVSRWLKSSENAEVRARLRVLQQRDPDGGQAAAAFAGIRALADITLSGVYATATSLLAAYDSPRVQENSRSGFDVSDFFNGEANTLYLCAPPEEQELLAPVFTALIRRVIAEAYRRQALGERLLPLLLLLDEAGNIARIEDLDTIATTAAGTDIQLVTVFHDLAQMEALYGGHRAQSIANNHSALLILPGNRDARTAQLVRDVLLDEPMTGGVRRQSVRRLPPGTAFCVYEHLASDMIELRSSSHDPDLREVVGEPIEEDPAFRRLITFGRRSSA
ncbi:type IV secretory system conjugative DNA transfer family protein [Micromonospora sp. SCSIO 07396]